MTKPYNGHYSDKLLCDWCGELWEGTTDVACCDCGREVDSMELAQQWYVDAVEEIKRLSPIAAKAESTQWNLNKEREWHALIERLLADRGYPEDVGNNTYESIGYRIKKLCDMADELKALKQPTPAASPQKG